MLRQFNGAYGVDDNAIGVDQGLNANIKLIQRGETTWGTVTTKNITLAVPIDPKKSVVFVDFYPNTNAAVIQTAIEIVDATTIGITRTTATSNTQPIYWQVVEFTNVKSKQTGTTVGTGALNVVTISAINMSKSLLVMSHKSTLAGTTYTSFTRSGKITSATSISLLSVLTTSTIYWQVIEFY